jgi:phospholipase/carboxylesterase
LNTASAPEPHGGQPVETAGAALSEARAAVIMIHGRNAAPGNILDLVGLFDQPGVAYLAPAAAGGAWYPLSFLAPIEQNEPGISSGIAVVHTLIDGVIESGIPAHKILLLGFSQGACLACTAAHRRPMRYGGVIVYSGGLIGPPGTAWRETGDFDRTPLFFGCSDKDAHVPETRVNESAAVLERLNAAVTKRIYPGMGHTINHDEIKFTKDLLAALA